MTEGGYYEQKSLSPTGVTMVVLLHGVALFALLTAKGDIYRVIKDPPPVLINIKEPPPPDPVREQTHREKPQHQTQVDIVKPLIDLPPRPTQPHELVKLDVPPIPWTPPGTITATPPPPPIPVHEAVKTEARIDSGSALQPPYPASAQREGAEGSVQVRIAIGSDGRVKAVQKISASRDDFYSATERQALRYWRFKPATVDGRPIESSKLMTVHFRLDDVG